MGLEHFYIAAAGVYERHLSAAAHTVGKANTQQIERKHLTLRTRIKRLAHKQRAQRKKVDAYREGKGKAKKYA